jgi:hypothetical protein
VVALLERIRHVGVPLKEFAGVIPYRGVVTGFNEAFLVDTPTRNQLVSEHPSSAAILKKYLRGQDIDRWSSTWPETWMIFARRGIEIDKYPAIKQHLLKFRARLEPKPSDWSGGKWEGRKPGVYKWYELQDPIEYWRKFEQPKIMYQDIAWHSHFSLDREALFSNNTVHFLPTENLWLLAVLNAPISWWFAWLRAQHGKDEALRLFGEFMQDFPIPQPLDESREQAEETIHCLIDLAGEEHAGRRAVLDWLRVEFAVEKPSQKLQDTVNLAPDTLVAEVKKARGKQKPLSVVGLKALRDEHARSIVPLQSLAAESRRLEQDVAALVNAAYGLTPEEIALMWQTAPPRMPCEPPTA